MPFPSFNDLSSFAATSANEIQQFVSYLFGWLAKEHNDDGSHNNITATSVSTGTLTVATPTTETGNITGNLIPATNNTYTLGAFPTSPANTPLLWKDAYVESHLYLGLASSGGLNPVTVTGWTATLGSNLVWQAGGTTGQQIQINNSSGSARVLFSPDSILGFYLSVLGSMNATGNIQATGSMTAGSYKVGTNATLQLQITTTGSFSDAAVHTVGNAASLSGQFTIVSTGGTSVIPFWSNGGLGVAYHWTALDPDTGWVINASGPSFSFADGAGTNTYAVVFNNGSGDVTVQRTAGAANYTTSFAVWS